MSSGGEKCTNSTVLIKAVIPHVLLDVLLTGPWTSASGAIHYMCVSVLILWCVHIFSSRQSVRWSFISNTSDDPWSGMLDGVQVGTHAGVLFRVSFLRLVPLMDVSMSVTTETRYTLGISRCYIDRERTDGFTWWGLLCPPTWRPARHAVHPLLAATAPAPHLNLYDVKEETWKPMLIFNFTLSRQYWAWLLMYSLYYIRPSFDACN